MDTELSFDEKGTWERTALNSDADCSMGQVTGFCTLYDGTRLSERKNLCRFSFEEVQAYLHYQLETTG